MDNNKLSSIVDSLIVIYPILYKGAVKNSRYSVNKNLCDSHYEILLSLDNDETHSISKIAKKLHITKPQMTVLLDKLLQDGLLCKTSSLLDRRVTNITLTEKGKEFIKSYRDQFKNNIKNIISRLQISDLEEMERALSNLKSSALKLDSMQKLD